jgi:dolichol-phosphate mannosyltransferase
MKKNFKIDKLSIIIPIYNEEKNIKKLSNLIKKNLKIKKFEIIFVDDDSTDNSRKILEDINKKDQRIKSIIRKNKTKDLSRSCILGFKKSKYKTILVMDGDLQHNPIFIPKLINSYNSSFCDLVVGCRNFFSDKNNGLNFFRTLASVFLIFIINSLLGKKTSDPMSGFFLFKKEFFLNSEKRLFKKGYKILADIIYANKEKININDVKIKFNKRKSGHSKIKIKILGYLIYFIFIKMIKKNVHKKF